MVVKRDAQASKDRADSKEAAMLQQSTQLDELAESRREDSRKLQVAESKVKEAEEKRQREDGLRCQLETTYEELRDERDGCLEAIRDYKASVHEFSTKLASAESRNADMAERVRYVEGAVALLETCFL